MRRGVVLLIRLVRALQPKAPGKTAASSSQPRSEPEQWKLSYSSLKPLEEWGVEKTSRVPYDLLLSKAIAQFLCGRGYELERKEERA